MHYYFKKRLINLELPLSFLFWIRNTLDQAIGEEKSIRIVTVNL
jgi:hypothetical protein